MSTIALSLNTKVQSVLKFSIVGGCLWLTVPQLARRGLQTSSACLTNIRVGRPKTTPKRTKRLTYEESQPPYLIGVNKAWNSWNTSNLEGEGRKPETVAEDAFIRRFMDGTWPRLIVSEVVIKRKHNLISVCAILTRKTNGVKIHFLTGYSEELLSCLLKCPVKLELSFVTADEETGFRMI